MNVLQIGYDKSLLKDGKGTPSNTIKRMTLISKNINNLVIAVLTAENKKKGAITISDKITVYPMNSNGFVSIFRSYKECSDICKKYKIDIISSQDPFMSGIIGYMLKVRHKIPLNIQIHGDLIDNPFWLKQSKTNYFWNILAKFILKRAETIRTVNEDSIKNLEKKGIVGNKFMNFPIFIETDIFTSNNIKKLDFGDYEKVILFVGFLNPTKGIDTLLMAAPEVLNKHPKTLFLIVGDGSEKNKLQKISDRLKISNNVIFTGSIHHENLPPYYKTSDIFVLPSRAEAWGRVVMEALLLEKPVIVSDVCKISETLLKEKCGISFTVEDHIDLSNKIIELLENKNVRNEMGKKGKNFVIKNYSESALVPNYLKLWKKTIEEANK